MDDELEAERYATMYTKELRAAGLENDEDILMPSRIRDFVLNKQKEEAVQREKIIDGLMAE